MPSNYDIGLPEFDVIDRIEGANGDYIYILELKEELKEHYKTCPQCGARMHVHKKTNRQVQDLGERGHNVGLLIKSVRYRCSNPECNYTCGEDYPSIYSSGKLTNRLRETIKDDALLRPFKEVAVEYGVSPSAVSTLFKEKADELKQDYEVYAPKVLGIDEVHLDTTYYGVYVDIERNNIIEITESRSKATVKRFIRSLPDYDTKIEVVTMDMWRPYRDAVYETLPGVPVVIDKFHVIKELNKQLDAVRASISRNIRDAGTRISLKNNRFLMLKAQEDLNPRQAAMLRQLLETYPQFSDPYDMKETFRAIYFAESRAEAEETYQEWLKIYKDNNMTCYDNFIATVANWYTEIFNYFDYRYTNAGTESMNNRIREIDGAGRGYSFEVLRDKMVLRPYIARRSGAVDFSILDEDD